MNEDEITRIVADALREAWRNNHYSNMDMVTENAVANVLDDVACALADEIWPNRSEESPDMPEEWAAAIRGE
jgi:hypothetical protein